MSVPSAQCPQCGSRHCGWALLNPRHQICPHCGASLKIDIDGQTFEGYSPFKAERLIIKPATETSSPPTKKQEKPRQ